jgi:multisubunit Na+/H+ antiporter MnhB subunit
MFSIVVIAVAIGVFTMYFRHDRQMRRKRRAELARGEDSPPTTKPP